MEVSLSDSNWTGVWAGRDAFANYGAWSATVSGTRGSRPGFPIFDEDIVADPVPIALVLTAIPVEHVTMREHLHDVQEQVHRAGTIFVLGLLSNSPWRVVLTKTGQGNPRAAAITERAISHYDPDVVMLVGVAGRLHDDLALGDVVVAKKVYAIHKGIEDDDGHRPRPETWWPHDGHVERADRIAASGVWHDVLPDQLRSGAKAVVRPIASGEVVLNSVQSPLAQMIRQNFDDAAAIEMEGAGVALASQLNESPTIVVRGISDYADGQKEAADRAGWQQCAARNAAAFAVTLLAHLTPTRRATAIRAVEEDLLFGSIDQRIAAARELSRSRHEKAVPLLMKGFDVTLDPDVSCRIIWALAGLGTEAAEDALRALVPRYDIERLIIQEALESWREQPQRQGDAHP